MVKGTRGDEGSGPLGEGDGECPDAGEMPTESPEFEKTRRLAEQARGDRRFVLHLLARRLAQIRPSHRGPYPYLPSCHHWHYLPCLSKQPFAQIKCLKQPFTI